MQSIINLEILSQPGGLNYINLKRKQTVSRYYTEADLKENSPIIEPDLDTCKGCPVLGRTDQVLNYVTKKLQFWHHHVKF